MRKTALKLLQYSTPDPHGECWLWEAALNGKGYPYLRIPKDELEMHPRVAGAHRLSLWIFRGPFDLALDVDHTCRLRACINPYHLEAVTVFANRSDGVYVRWYGEEMYDHGF